MTTKTNIDAYTAAREAMGYDRDTAHTAALAMLEAIADRFHINDTLRLLAVMADEKAAHIRETWHDERTAREFERVASAIERTAAKVNV